MLPVILNTGMQMDFLITNVVTAYGKRLYRANFVKIHALIPEILRFEFVTLFVKHTVNFSRISFRERYHAIFVHICLFFF